MNPLELSERLRDDYRRFTWSTYPIADETLRERLEGLVDSDSLLWRGPYLSVQPRFRLDATPVELGQRIGLPGPVTQAFSRLERLFTHQVQAIERIHAGRNTLMATGTGSGKTEGWLIPGAAQAYENRHRPGVKTIALYPMNALVNDQQDRVKAVCEQLGLRYGVYTGATSSAERARLQENPPDFLLTNYSMLEFILTRREDRALFGDGVLRHLVLDEVHTYQGALGTEIACLVRRLRSHVDAAGLVCIGLSATVSAGGDHEADLRRTAEFASNLFAAPFDVPAIVEETPVPTPVPDPERIGPAPDAAAVRQALVAGGDVTELRRVLGNAEGSPVLDLLRSQLAEPRTVDTLVDDLAKVPTRRGIGRSAIQDEVAGWLLLGAGTIGGAGHPVLEAKVHLFLRSLPHLVRCSAEAGHLLLNGPEECTADGCDAEATAGLGACLGCGQDYDLEAATPGGPIVRYVARWIPEDPAEQPLPRTSWYRASRCVKCGRGVSGSACGVCGGRGREVYVAEPADPDKPLTRCPVCGYSRSSGAVQEFTARTAAAISATAFSLHQGLAEQEDNPMLRRLLIFADSRQDTAFQAGYLRDRVRAVRVRRLIMRVIEQRRRTGGPAASFNSVVEGVYRLGVTSGLYEEPDGADARRRALRVCEWDVLGEVSSDERRPPTLERLGLISVGYPGLEALTDDDLEPLLNEAGPDPSAARWLLTRFCDHARRRGGVAHELLRTRLESKVEWELSEAGATVRTGRPVTGIGPTTPKPAGSDPISTGAKGALARIARTAFPNLSNGTTSERVVRAAVQLLADHGVLDSTTVGNGRQQGQLWQVMPQAIEIRSPEAVYRCRACGAVQPDPSPRNRCATFNCRGRVEPWPPDREDYERSLADGPGDLDIRAAEHSGQVPLGDREELEEQFKEGELNLLVCTMTLELGVDLGQLLAVVLRNVPPRPSNYAQRAGRAGRREERVALVVTFAGGMPHDNYYYARPVEMIRGAIRPPAFLLDNRRVITRHARALALELCGENLPAWMGDLVSPDPQGALCDVEGVAQALAERADPIADQIYRTFRRGLTDDEFPWLTREWAHSLVTSWISDLDDAVQPYRTRQKGLLEEGAQAAARLGQPGTARALQTINASLTAMRQSDRSRAYVLSYLGFVGFLPSYAFPTDTTTLRLETETSELSQDAVRALQDYAPGQLVYARGARWLVDRVDFQRANLVNAEGIGALPSANLCRRCDTVNDPTAASCLSCDGDDLQPLITVPLRALSASRRQRIAADEERRSRRPFEVSHHLGAPNTTETWLYERTGLVLQWERNAALTVLNRGRTTAAQGQPERFLVCTGCGMWFDAIPGSRPTQAQQRRQKFHDSFCKAQDLQPTVLRVERAVDCLQILPDIESLDIRPDQLQAFLASVRAALDLGCRVILQAGENEVSGFDWPRPGPNSSDALLRLAVLYEQVPGGAGYLRQLAQRFGEVAAALVPVLDDCTCERSCYACLRS